MGSRGGRSRGVRSRVVGVWRWWGQELVVVWEWWVKGLVVKGGRVKGWWGSGMVGQGVGGIRLESRVVGSGVGGSQGGVGS